MLKVQVSKDGFEDFLLGDKLEEPQPWKEEVYNTKEEVKITETLEQVCPDLAWLL